MVRARLCSDFGSSRDDAFPARTDRPSMTEERKQMDKTLFMRLAAVLLVGGITTADVPFHRQEVSAQSACSCDGSFNAYVGAGTFVGNLQNQNPGPPAGSESGCQLACSLWYEDWRSDACSVHGLSFTDNHSLIYYWITNSGQLGSPGSAPC
jgi:hypothetical protein